MQEAAKLTDFLISNAGLVLPLLSSLGSVLIHSVRTKESLRIAVDSQRQNWKFLGCLKGANGESASTGVDLSCEFSMLRGRQLSGAPS